MIHKHQWMPVIFKFSNSDTSYIQFERCLECSKLREIGPVVRREGNELHWIKTASQLQQYFPNTPITETAVTYADFIRSNLIKLQV